MKTQLPVEINNQLKEIWQAVLGMPIEASDENFFALGGNSIQAMEVVSQTNQRFHVDLSMGDFFETLTINKLCSLIQNRVSSY